MPVTHLIVELQKDDFSQILRQLLQGFSQDCILFVIFMTAFAILASLNRLSLPLSFPQHVLSHVPADGNDPRAEPLRFFQLRKLPAQVLRALLLAVALYPLRRAFMDLGRCGGLVIASLLIIIGQIAGLAGLIEGVVYTEDVPLGLVLAHLPEVVIQAMLFGYLLLWWERKVESKVSGGRRAAMQGAS